MTRWIVLAAVTVAVALLRILGVKHEAYQAAAHLFVGGLAGAWLIERERFYAVAFWLLCAVEIICFAHDRLL